MKTKRPTYCYALALILCAGLATVAGCGGGGKGGKQKDAFFTSGSREADQRAQQRMAKDQQLSGGNEQTSTDKAKPGQPTTNSTALLLLVGGCFQ